jgi:ABC-type nitrate/sulfonate/bicarbonate transport system ATPase subunit
MNIVLTATKLNHSFREGRKNTEVLKDVSFSVREGEFFVIIGPSGCGKSTLLRILAGLLPNSGDTLKFASPETQKEIAMVFQSFALFPWLTVKENIEFGLKMTGKRNDKLVQSYIKDLGLKSFEKNVVRELSGGMKQRVGLARAFAMTPKILFLDEPFSQLDAFTAEKLREELMKIWAREKITVVMVTHLIEEAMQMGDRIMVMSARPGHVKKILENTLPRPRDERSPAFWEIEDELAGLIEQGDKNS